MKSNSPKPWPNGVSNDDLVAETSRFILDHANIPMSSPAWQEYLAGLDAQAEASWAAFEQSMRELNKLAHPSLLDTLRAFWDARKGRR
jgi:hypothetical protein